MSSSKSLKPLLAGGADCDEDPGAPPPAGAGRSRGAASFTSPLPGVAGLFYRWMAGFWRSLPRSLNNSQRRAALFG